MKKEVLKVLKEIEKKEKVRVLFSIESGSRAWRWESDDSDYDIRGVFVQDYLKFTPLKEQIDYSEGDFDLSLWDLKKFLRLFVKSNPTTWEWLSSDIVYMDNKLREELKDIFKKNFNKESLKRHYLSMARQNFEKYIRKSKKVNLKKYLYVLRSIACIIWIERYQTPPPKDYRKVIRVLPKQVQTFFKKNVRDKKESEKIIGKKNKKIDAYVEKFFFKKFNKDCSTFNLDKLNKLFKKAIK